MFFQSKDKNEDFSDTETKRHKTHVTALTMLVLATFVVVFIALSMVESGRSGERKLVQKSDSNQAVSVISDIERMSSLDGFPNGLPVPDTATVTQNYRNNLLNDHVQRVLVFEVATDEFDSQLADNLQSWASQNSYSIAETNRINGNGIILAEKPSSQLIITWISTSARTRIEINMVRI
jgi:cell division protein FtsN